MINRFLAKSLTMLVTSATSSVKYTSIFCKNQTYFFATNPNEKTSAATKTQETADLNKNKTKEDQN